MSSHATLTKRRRYLLNLNDKKANYDSHYAFITHGQKEKIIPDGLTVYLESSIGNNDEEFLNNWNERLQTFSLTLMSDVLTFCEKNNKNCTNRN